MPTTACAQNPTVTDAQCAQSGGLADILRREKTALSIAEVAALLSVSKTKLHAMVQAGQIPHWRIGASIRFDPQAVANWLESKQVFA